MMIYALFSKKFTLISILYTTKLIVIVKEEEIRPEQLMKENAELHKEDVKKLLVYRNEFVNVSCSACNSDDYKPFFEKKGFTFVNCRKCDMCYVNPRPTFEMLTEFYTTSKSISHWEKIFSASENTRREKIFKPRVAKVLEICKKNGIQNSVIVDVGAGFGTFCEEIKKQNFFEKIIAVEPSHDLAEVCRQKGLDVVEKLIEDAELDKVDVITSFELIEHLFEPSGYLLSCRKTLSENGLLILTTPNAKGFDLITLGKIADNFGGPNHINYFHPHSIELLLKRCGFELIEISTPGKLDAEIVRKKVLSGEFNISEQLFLRHILLDNWESLGKIFQDFLSENKLSSHMWVVAKKIKE